MAANDASEATPLGGSNHIYKLLVVEDVNQNSVASLNRNFVFAATGLCRLDGNLFDHLDGRNIRLGKVASHRLVHFRGFDEVDVADLGGIVAVLRKGLKLRDDARASLEHGDRVDVAPFIEHLSHSNFFTENSDY